MTTLRKLELAGGVLIGAIGAYVAVNYIYLDYRTSEHLGLEIPLTRIVLMSFLIELLPALAISFGSYLHSVKRKQMGQFLVLMASLVSVTIFLLVLLRVPFVPYGRLDLFWLSFLSAALAIGTSVVSVFVQRGR